MPGRVHCTQPTGERSQRAAARRSWRLRGSDAILRPSMTKHREWLAAGAISTGAIAQTPREVPAFDLERLTFGWLQPGGCGR